MSRERSNGCRPRFGGIRTTQTTSIARGTGGRPAPVICRGNPGKVPLLYCLGRCSNQKRSQSFRLGLSVGSRPNGFYGTTAKAAEFSDDRRRCFRLPIIGDGNRQQWTLSTRSEYYRLTISATSPQSGYVLANEQLYGTVFVKFARSAGIA